MSVRRALLFTSADRYSALVINFLLAAFVARILSANEFGHQVLAASIYATAIALREFASTNFLIQKREFSRETAQAQFTVLLALSASMGVVLCIAAPFVAHLYGAPTLQAYIYLIALALQADLVSVMLTTLMRRDMQFGRVAAVNVTITFVNAACMIFFVLNGHGFMSYAYASLASVTAGSVIAAFMRPELWVFAPRFTGWGEIVKFGAYTGFNAAMFKVYDALPYLVLARLMPLASVSYYNRALFVCQTPEKVFLGGVVNVVLPAFAQRVRTGGDLKSPYLLGVQLITALQWPALILLAILAHPIVSVILGPQWGAVAPLVQILAIAFMAAFSAELNFPLLVAVGAMRDTFLRGLIVWPVSAAILIGASFFGLYATALSSLIILPFQSYISLLMVRQHVQFTWREFWASMRGSALVMLCSAAGPLAFVAYNGFSFEMSFVAAVLVGVLAGIGWLIGLWATKHPLMHEIERAVQALRSRLTPRSGLADGVKD